MSRFWVLLLAILNLWEKLEKIIVYIVFWMVPLDSLTSENVGFALQIKSLKIWRFGGGNFGI